MACWRAGWLQDSPTAATACRHRCCRRRRAAAVLVRAGNACVEAQCCKDWAHRFEIAARVRGEHGKFKLGAEHDVALAAGFRECGPGVVGTAELAGLNEQWVSHAKSKCGQRIQ